MIDGVPIEDIIKYEDGHFMRTSAVSIRELTSRKSYTCFIAYMYDGDPEVSEEIDVMATDEGDARIICELALTWRYEPGGKIAFIRENIPGVTYF